MRSLVLLLGAALGACGASGAVVVAAAPPVPAHFVVISNGRVAGEAELTVSPDGARRTHLRYEDRGRGPELETELILKDGAPISVRTRGHDYWAQPVDEELALRDGRLTWRS